MTMIRSLSASASSRYWVVNNVAMPRFLKPATRSQMVCLLRGSSPVVGSSRNTTSGRTTKPQAMSIRRRMPPEYVPTRRSAACDQIELAREVLRPVTAPPTSPGPADRPNMTRFSRPVSMSSSATCCPVSMIDRRTLGRLGHDVESRRRWHRPGPAGSASTRCPPSWSCPHRSGRATRPPHRGRPRN